MYFHNTIFTAVAAITLGIVPYRWKNIDPVVFAKSICFAVSDGINWKHHNIIPQNLIDSYGLPAIEKAKELIINLEIDERISELVEILPKTSCTYYYLSSNFIYWPLSIIGTGASFIFEYGINNLVNEINLTTLKFNIVHDILFNEPEKKIIKIIKNSNFYQYSLDKINSTNKAAQFINNIVNSENGSTENLECITSHLRKNHFTIYNSAITATATVYAAAFGAAAIAVVVDAVFVADHVGPFAAVGAAGVGAAAIAVVGAAAFVADPVALVVDFAAAAAVVVAGSAVTGGTILHAVFSGDIIAIGHNFGAVVGAVVVAGSAVTGTTAHTGAVVGVAAIASVVGVVGAANYVMANLDFDNAITKCIVN